MIALKRVAAVSLTALIGISGFEPGEELFARGPGGLISQAEARVGRPLTPVSYAGVARRTSRRVARRTAVRVSTLPAGCVYGAYYGGNYYRCGGAFYAKSGTVYVQVVFD